MMPSQAPLRERLKEVLACCGVLWLGALPPASGLNVNCAVDCVHENANLAMVAARFVACNGRWLREGADDGDPGFGIADGAGADADSSRDRSRRGEVGQDADSGRGGGDFG